MKRYVSLGSAMMMGYVAAQAKETYDFEESAITGMHKPVGSEIPDLHVDEVVEEDAFKLQANEDAFKLQANEDPPIPIDGYNNGFYNGPDWGLMKPQKPKVI
jgi:hypothetical protein